MLRAMASNIDTNITAAPYFPSKYLYFSTDDSSYYELSNNVEITSSNAFLDCMPMSIILNCGIKNDK